MVENKDFKKNKYYIPKLEEFYVGFEYEILCNPYNTSMDDISYHLEWSKEVFYLNDSHINLIKYVDIQADNIKEGNVRVKHLDKSDIESFGFEQVISTEEGYFHVFPNLLSVQMQFLQGKWRIELIMFDNPNEIVFNGKIKNKSEFRKILQMIGATENE